MVNRYEIGRWGEDLGTAELRIAGTASNVNRSIKTNYPVIDAVARIGTARILVQIRTTTIQEGKFTAEPEDARAVASLAAERGCHAIWEFVHITADATIIRFATANTVAALAEQAIARYPRTNRYHIWIDDLTIDIHRITEILHQPVRAA
jgi:hypothetical protein